MVWKYVSVGKENKGGIKKKKRKDRKPTLTSLDPVKYNPQ
jgi:hypothetical protein